MKTTVVKTGIVATLLVLAISAYAANTITLNHPAVVNGKQLAAGQYEIKFSSDGVVTFLRGKSEVATAKAKLEDRNSKAAYNAVITKRNGSGAPAIMEIQFEGKKQVLVLGESSQMSDSATGQQ